MAIIRKALLISSFFLLGYSVANAQETNTQNRWDSYQRESNFRRNDIIQQRREANEKKEREKREKAQKTLQALNEAQNQARQNAVRYQQQRKKQQQGRQVAVDMNQYVPRAQYDQLYAEYTKLQKNVEMINQQLGQFEKLTDSMKNPILMKFGKVFGNEEVVTSGIAVLENTSWHRLIMSQIIALIAVLIFRSFLMGKAKRWWDRFLMGSFFTLFYISLLVFFVPALTIRKPYFDFVRALYRSVFA